MKKIYIILTQTGSVVSQMVKLYTRKKYGHVSISLDRELKNMYSFGRLKATNPFMEDLYMKVKNMVLFINLKIQLQQFIH